MFTYKTKQKTAQTFKTEKQNNLVAMIDSDHLELEPK